MNSRMRVFNPRPDFRNRHRFPWFYLRDVRIVTLRAVIKYLLSLPIVFSLPMTPFKKVFLSLEMALSTQ